MFESDYSDEINLSYKSVTGSTLKEEISLTLWAEHFKKSEKYRNKFLTKIFEKELNHLKSLYCFLEDDQIMGKTFAKFGIPNMCGKIDKKFCKLSSKKSHKVNKYERRNKAYTLKTQLLSKKTHSDSRYCPVVQKWSDNALNKFKPSQKIPPSEAYTFDKDNLIDESEYRKDVTHSSPSTDIRTHTEYLNSTVSIKNHDGEGTKRNLSTSDNVEYEIKGSLKKIDHDNIFKKSVRFNDNDLCSFAPTQEYLSSSTSESPDKDAINDDLIRNKTDLVLLNGLKLNKTCSVETNINSLGEDGKILADISTTLSHETQNVIEEQIISVPVQTLNEKNTSDTNFEIEAYDNENIVIEEFSESYSEGQNNQEEILNRGCHVNKNTEEYIVKHTETIPISHEKDKQPLIFNNSNVNKIIERAKYQDHKPSDTEKENLSNTELTKNIENDFAKNKHEISVKTTENSLNSAQNIITTTENNLDSKEKHLEITLGGITVNLKDNLKLQEISHEVLSQQKKCQPKGIVVPETPSSEEVTESTSCTSNIVKNNDFQIKDVVVPETPSPEELTECKSSKSNVEKNNNDFQIPLPNSFDKSETSNETSRPLDKNAVVLETPSSSESAADIRNPIIHEVVEKFVGIKVDSPLKKDTLRKNPAQEVVDDWPDQEFFPISPLGPLCIGSSDIITPINMGVTSSREEGNNKKSCKDDKENSLTRVSNDGYKDDKTIYTGLGITSPCDSLSGRDYVSDSSQYESEEEPPTHEVAGFSNVNYHDTSNEFTAMKPNSEKENYTASISIDHPNEVSSLMCTTIVSSSLCTPNCVQGTENVGLKKQEEAFSVANAPSKLLNSTKIDPLGTDKSQTNTSQDQRKKSFSKINFKDFDSPIKIKKTQKLENKVCKVLFPLQNQSSVAEINEIELNQSKLICWATKPHSTDRPGENKKINVFTNQGCENSVDKNNENENHELNSSGKEMKNSESGEQKTTKESIESPSLSNSGIGTQSKNVAVKGNLNILYDIGDNHASSNNNSCSQISDEEIFSICSPIQINNESSPLSSKTSPKTPTNVGAVVETLNDHQDKSIRHKNLNNGPCSQLVNKDTFSSTQNEHDSSSSFHRECAYILLDLSKGGSNSETTEALAKKDEFRSSQVSNSSYCGNPETKIEDTISDETQSSNSGIYLPDSIQVKEMKDHVKPSSENKIIRNTKLHKDERKIIFNDQSYNPNHNCDKPQKLKSLLTAPKTIAKVCTDTEKIIHSIEMNSKKDSSREESLSSSRTEHLNVTDITNEETVNENVSHSTAQPKSYKVIISESVSAFKSYDKPDSIRQNIHSRNGENFEPKINRLNKNKNKSVVKTTNLLEINHCKNMKENKTESIHPRLKEREKQLKKSVPVNNMRNLNENKLQLDYLKVDEKEIPTKKDFSQILTTETLCVNESLTQNHNQKCKNDKSANPNSLNMNSLSKHKYKSIIKTTDVIPINSLQNVNGSQSQLDYPRQEENGMPIKKTCNRILSTENLVNESLTQNQKCKNDKTANPNSLNMNSSSKQKYKSIIKTTDVIPINSLQNVNGSQSQLDYPRQEENGMPIKNSTCNRILSTENLCMNESLTQNPQYKNDEPANLKSLNTNRLRKDKYKSIVKSTDVIPISILQNLKESKSQLDNPRLGENKMLTKKTCRRILTTNTLCVNESLTQNQNQQFNNDKPANLKSLNINSLRKQKYKSLVKSTDVMPINNRQILNESKSQLEYPRLEDNEMPKKKTCRRILTAENLRVNESLTEIQNQQVKNDKPQNLKSINMKCLSKQKSKSIVKISDVIPINNLQNLNESKSILDYPRLEENEMAKKKICSRILTTENLCVNESLTKNQNQQYKNDKPENLKNLHIKSLNKKKCKSNIYNMDVVSSKNLTNYVIHNIISMQENTNKSGNNNPINENLPTNSKNELSYPRYEEKWVTMGDRIESILISDDEESNENLSQIMNCTNGNASPLSSIKSGTVVLSEISNTPTKSTQGQNNPLSSPSYFNLSSSSENDFEVLYDSFAKSRNNQLKRRFNENFDYTSDDSSCKENPAKSGNQENEFGNGAKTNPLSPTLNFNLSSSSENDFEVLYDSFAKSRNNQLKRRFNENFDYTSDDSHCKANPAKSGNQENEVGKGAKIVSSDDIPSYLSDLSKKMDGGDSSSGKTSISDEFSVKYDYEMEKVSKNDQTKVSHDAIFIQSTSPIPSDSDELVSNCTETPLSRSVEVDLISSPLYDNDGRSSDYYFCDMFDD